MAEHGNEYSPPMPPAGCGAHVLEHFWTVGPAMSGSMGDGPLTHAEICAYQENTGTELSEWEASLLVRLSREYLAESHRATKRDCPAPWQHDDCRIDRILAERDARDAIRALSKL